MFTPMAAAGHRLALFTPRYVEQIFLNKIEQIFHNVFCRLRSLKVVKKFPVTYLTDALEPIVALLIHLRDHTRKNK